MMLSFLTALILSTAAAQTPAKAPAAPEQVLIGEYEGVLPCADCTGLRTRLALSAPRSATPDEGTFVLTETYEGRDVTNRTTGTWKLVRGTGTDKQAVVYQLNPSQSQPPQYWLRASDAELRPLDSRRRELPGRGNVPIRRVSLTPAALPGGYRAARADDVQVQMAATFAAGQQLEKSPTLTVQRIVRAESQVVAGINFRICLSVKRNETPETAEAVVYQDLKGQMSLTSWTWGGCK